VRVDPMMARGAVGQVMKGLRQRSLHGRASVWGRAFDAAERPALQRYT
jgi:hypothetical protein